MKEYINISRVYFIGIGGIGMSALARYYLHKNVIVCGYDKTATELSLQLEKEGANIHYEDNPQLLDREAELVVYTPAIPTGHKEWNWFKNHEYQLAKRSDVLSVITDDAFNICVAGTHGKTTISTMIAHILRHAEFGCNAFLGGISVNYQTNFWSSSNKVNVVEADEYDRSFLKLSPDIAVVSAMDADHLDIYGTVENMQEAFMQFAGKLKIGGLLLTRYGIPGKEFYSDNHLRYSIMNDAADIYGANITMRNGGYEFDVIAKDWMVDNVKLNMGGMHNVENAIVSIAIAHHLKIDTEKIKSSLATFKGVKRRFEYIVSPAIAEKQKNNVVFIDDYAHHPEELKALINSAKSLFENRKCTIIFQPHLYTRTRDLAKIFAEALDQADEVLLLPIYPARELPIEGVSSELILGEMNNTNASVISPELLLQYLESTYLDTVNKSLDGQLLITAGAGDISQLVLPIKKILLNN